MALYEDTPRNAVEPAPLHQFVKKLTKIPIQKLRTTTISINRFPAPVEQQYNSRIRAEAVSLNPLSATYSGDTITVSMPMVERCSTKPWAFNSDVHHFSLTLQGTHRFAIVEDYLSSPLTVRCRKRCDFYVAPGLHAVLSMVLVAVVSFTG